MADLRECPFCGCRSCYIKTFRLGNETIGEVYCPQCECRGPWGSLGDDDGMCAAQWNNRPEIKVAKSTSHNKRKQTLKRSAVP